MNEKEKHQDLDHLAGDWSAAEEKEFVEATEYFEKKDLKEESSAQLDHLESARASWQSFLSRNKWQILEVK